MAVPKDNWNEEHVYGNIDLVRMVLPVENKLDTRCNCVVFVQSEECYIPDAWRQITCSLLASLLQNDRSQRDEAGPFKMVQDLRDKSTRYQFISRVPATVDLRTPDYLGNQNRERTVTTWQSTRQFRDAHPTRQSSCECSQKDSSRTNTTSNYGQVNDDCEGLRCVAVSG